MLFRSRLLELLGELAAERKRRVVIIFDEFQEVITLDSRFPNLMRAVFQAQPEVSHVYLGSKRHMMRRIFNDDNEPFWRSAKPMELGVIAAADFKPYIESRFRAIEPLVLERLLAMTHGHPYATQELGYFLWEEASGGKAGLAQLDRAITSLLRSEHAHFSLIWEHAASTVTTGAIRRPLKTRRRSLARKSGVAMSSWIAFASFSASFSFVGVVIRSTWATSTRSRASFWATRQTSDDFPKRRGAKTTTSWPLRMSARSSATSRVRSVNASSRARAPKLNGLRV